MALVIGIAIWQWRRRPLVAKLPERMQVPELWQRVTAGAIDFGVPLIAVLIAFGLYKNSQWQALAGAWLEAMRDPELYDQSPALLWLFGLYVGHVMVAEILRDTL